MYAFINTANINNLAAVQVKVEVAGCKGLPAVRITGLPDTAVRESYYRVSTSFKSCGIELPLKRFFINFIPAGIPKKGSGFDLPIAAALLKAIGIIPPETFNDHIIIGELSLTGEIKPVSGVLPILDLANKNNKKVIIPLANAGEAEIFRKLAVPLGNIRQLMDFAMGIEPEPAPAFNFTQNTGAVTPDFLDVRGQNIALRCAEICAAGRHHMLLIGSPGCGKSMIGERIPWILPDLDNSELLEVNSIYSIAGLIDSERGIMERRPYRAPHHSISDSALIGGKNIGEISLAHKGILFLDELSEFRYNVLNALREPLEKGYIDISRASYSHRFPADFLLVAASNPCDCGNFLKKDGSCACSDASLQRFRRRLNGPLMDRFDIKLVMSAPKIGTRELYEPGNNRNFSTAVVKERVKSAMEFLSGLREEKHRALLTPEARKILDRHINDNRLSIRNIRKTISVAGTIAGLEYKTGISENHMLESLNYTNSIGWQRQ